MKATALAALAITCFSLVGAEVSHAIAMHPNPIVSVDPFGGSRTLEFIGAASGIPQGGTVLAGSVDPGDISLVFQLFTVPGVLVPLWTSLGLTTGPYPGSFANIPVAGAGWIPGSEPDSLDDLLDVDLGEPSIRLIFGGALGDSASDLFFLSYDGLPLDATVSVCFGPGAVIVPEPASGLCVALGLGTMAIIRRRRRFAH